MDLGLTGKSAIVCASSKGLGRGCAMALARQGVKLVINARSEHALLETADAIRKDTGIAVTAVVADVTTREGRAALLAACPAPDILINNAGGPPAGDFRVFNEEDWVSALNSNMIAPIMLIKAVIDGMIERGFGRIVNITSRSVRTALPHLPLSNGARAGLTGFVAGLARQVAKHNVIINNLLPGAFETDRQMDAARQNAAKAGVPYDEFVDRLAAAIPRGRLGQPAEFGVACAFLCSAYADFIVGQNLLLDGGQFMATV